MPAICLSVFRLLSYLFIFAAMAAAADARAEDTLERIRVRGSVHCGGAERPGLAKEIAEDRWVGLEYELCRALASAVLGSPDKVRFSSYGSPDEFARVTRGDDDVFFLTAGEILAHGLADRVLPGPPVFVVEDRVMVPDAASEQHLQDLAGKGICFVSGETVDGELDGWFATRHLGFVHHAHSETGERNDAYGVQHCHAVAAESTELALVRMYRSSARTRGRLLPEVLGSVPVFASTGTGDARWSAAVAWVMHTLVAAERPGSHWVSGGAQALPLDGSALGLVGGWQGRMLEAVGNYGEIYARTLGAQSPLLLERGVNRPVIAGGAFAVPYAQ